MSVEAAPLALLGFALLSQRIPPRYPGQRYTNRLRPGALPFLLLRRRRLDLSLAARHHRQR
jgi:hypothetical protein